MAKARKWSCLKTSIVTTLCGIGHAGSSVLLGVLGIQLGISVKKLEVFESVRGQWAAWGLIAFGLVYFVYGLRRILRDRFDSRQPSHEKLTRYIPWALFVVFVFGPCEPLIPIFMYPAMKHNLATALLVTGVFSVMTIVTMLGIVLVSVFGIEFLPATFKRLERYGHAFTGLAILFCGLGVQWLGL
jgi:sulfite exporter TauE/SafE